MSNSLWSRPKELALNRKSRICIISEKKDNLVSFTQIFEHIFLEISVPFDIHPGISRILGWTIRFSEIQQFPDFLGPFPGNFRTICPRFENFGNFGRMEGAQGYLRKTTQTSSWNESKSLQISGEWNDDFFLSNYSKTIKNPTFFSQCQLPFGHYKALRRS